MRLLIVNPNSSSEITNEIQRTLEGSKTGACFTYYTPGPAAPASIDDTTTSVISAAVCFERIKNEATLNENYKGVLICCFSDHPLTHMLRENTLTPVVSIFEAAISHALLLGSRFGILTTGKPWKTRLTDGVRAFLGAGSSERFVGVEATGLGVLELHNGRAETIEKIKQGARNLAEKEADVIILGCAGFSGMEKLVAEGAQAGGAMRIAVVDGVKAGTETLMSLARQNYFY